MHNYAQRGLSSVIIAFAITINSKSGENYVVNIFMQNQYTNTLFTIAVVITTLTAILQIGSANLAFSQAVELLPIITGNDTLDRSLPVFYECIEEAVDASVNAQQDPYFEDEPTKNEVRECYRAVFIDNPSEVASNDDMMEEDEDEDGESGE